MSYVLEALKRSERQRQAAATPTLSSYVLPLRRNTEQPIVLIASGVAVGVCILLAAWWLMPTRPTPPESPVAAVTTTAPAASPTPKRKPSTSVISEEPTHRVPAAAPVGRPAERAASVSAPPAQATPVPGVPAAQPGPTEPVLAKSVTLATPPVEPPAPPRDAKPIAYSELPAAVRRALPAIELGGYAAAGDGAAMVVVNDELVHEGQEIAPGLVVEHIQPDGVIFRYRSYRFRR